MIVLMEFKNIHMKSVNEKMKWTPIITGRKTTLLLIMKHNHDNEL